MNASEPAARENGHFVLFNTYVINKSVINISAKKCNINEAVVIILVIPVTNIWLQTVVEGVSMGTYNED